MAAIRRWPATSPARSEEHTSELQSRVDISDAVFCLKEVRDVRYVGFWARCGAALLGAVILVALTYPVLSALYGMEYLDSSFFFLLVAAPPDSPLFPLPPFFAI